MELFNYKDQHTDVEVKAIFHSVDQVLEEGGVPRERIDSGNIRRESVLYMLYWHNRLKHNPDERAVVQTHLEEYIGDAVPDSKALTDSLVANKEIGMQSKEFVENLLVPIKTVDLVITKAGADSKGPDRDVLCLEREYYPLGLALPGGIINDSDEDNPLELPANVFAALRVAGEKVLHLGEAVKYEKAVDKSGDIFYVVSGNQGGPVIRLYPDDEGGYRYRENIKSIIRPSDPRHIVDTIGFRCEIDGEVAGDLVWRNRAEIMSPKDKTGGFAFGHHREIVTFVTSQTSIEKDRERSERDFVRSLVNNPLESYTGLSERFKASEEPQMTSMPELFPVVDRMLTGFFTHEINALCEQNPILRGIRDKAVISLRQVTLKSRTFCPYLPTLYAIASGVAFHDVIARHKRSFYDTMSSDSVTEHNPRTTPNASYHMYRYKYRYDQMMTMVPNEIVIPTFESLSATDLMRVRGVPIRFLGISEDFLYVDEFEQSPEEFYMHDSNHSWRMIMEDKKTQKEMGITQEEMVEKSMAFSSEYLDYIKIRKTDDEQTRELKKLKKIILFEIVHEDARPFLRDIICRYIQSKEGDPVPFEVPRIDPNTGYMDVVDTLDTGISTLSYVRNKLQHGFYDQVDAQLPQIVSPKYRSARWIARAAYDMLVELGAEPQANAEKDEDGNVSFEWLLKRTCAVGPDNVHDAAEGDPDVEVYGDGTDGANPRRYQANEKARTSSG